MSSHIRKYHSASVFRALWAGGLIVSLLMPPGSLPSLDLCWFKALTHHPCPGCGLTHSFLAIGHGHWVEAWNDNSFGYFWYVLALYGLSRPFFWKFERPSVEWVDAFLTSKFFWVGAGTSMFLVWGFRSFV